MPRKQFLADIAVAAEKNISNIIDIKRGDDDGDTEFLYVLPSGPPVAIGMVALDVSSYPDTPSMLFTKSSDVPSGVEEVLKDVGDFTSGMTVLEIIRSVSDRLRKLFATGSRNDPVTIDNDSDVEMVDDPGDDEAENDEELEENDSEDGGYPGFSDDESDGGYGSGGTSGKQASNLLSISPENAAKLNRRIRKDLRAAKFAGFKIGVLGGLHADSQTSLVSISIQASKLGMSEEALQAWDLKPQQYIVLLIRYSSGYKTFDAVITEPAKNLDIAFRIGVSNKYKPTLVQAIAAFTEVNKDSVLNGEQLDTAEHSTTEAAGFSSIFISSSLNDFINEQFLSLLKIRNSMGVGWDGAKQYYNDRLGKPDDTSSSRAEHYYHESTPKQSTIPDILASDHLVDIPKEPSFPLVTAQFAMRYLLRCTEFCLVCHDQIEGDFEALKPYVCDKPLCLYQYMSLGFGPSIEHQILTQPYVVDLLVSFCYVAAICQRIREYPTGMSLSVPQVIRPQTHSVPTNLRGVYDSAVHSTKTDTDNNPESAVEVKFDSVRKEILFNGGGIPCPVRNGDWVAITTASYNIIHSRVEDISLFPYVKLSDTTGSNIHPSSAHADLATPATTPPPTTLVPAHIVLYDKNFDDYDNRDKAETMVALLSTLPSIQEMRTYLLERSRYSDPSLRVWKERISPAALGLLRWITASNRSCIVQVDRCPGQDNTNAVGVRLDQKCENVADSWVQFRFAQGSPDKEQRFLSALQAQKDKLDARYPTMFAFHGSPLQNWHSIIRHGLDFRETLHGRAYGHGVYHGMDQNVSASYANANGGITWQGSDLKISSAMSVNEIVNSPSQFTSSTPYIVVQHVDWIQCRYLLVQVNQAQDHRLRSNDDNSRLVAVASAVPSSELIEQDPKYTPKTSLGKAIGIPKCATNASRVFRADNKAEVATIFNSKRQKTGLHSHLSNDETAFSDEDEIMDITFFLSDEEEIVTSRNFTSTVEGKGKRKVHEKSTGGSFLAKLGFSLSSKKAFTDFVPGSLDQDTLPLMDEPQYATPSATMRLSKELKAILKVQDSTPIHELGWYINPEMISNVYQWIVELHSFDADLPLAGDMKKAGTTSVVCEIRFGKDYPFSPPFIRVIRPRFLPFTQGGGGHVTGGGAMCMELLTNTGWSSVSSIEGVLLQVRLAIQNLEPKPARLLRTSSQQADYSTMEAIEAYKRACMTHGWEIPKNFGDFASGSGSGGRSYSSNH